MKRNKYVSYRPSQIVRCTCDRYAERVTGKVIYPHRRDLWNRDFWLCRECNAYVGCHPGTITPLGTLAGPELRKARGRAHDAFDPLWKAGQTSRDEAYQWLASELGISKANCHIGMFDLETCNHVIELCQKQDVWSFGNDET